MAVKHFNEDQPPILPEDEGGHRYIACDTTSDCAFQCGAWLGQFNSGGPSPFGRCPNNQRDLAPPPVTGAMNLKIRDRRTTAITSASEDGVSTTHWPYAIHDESRGMAFGAVVALVNDKADAEAIVKAMTAPMTGGDATEAMTLSNILAAKKTAYKKSLEDCTQIELAAFLITDDGIGSAVKTDALNRLIATAITNALTEASKRILAQTECTCGYGNGFDISLHDDGCEIIIAARFAAIVRAGDDNG